jgi:hypothetical protein
MSWLVAGPRCRVRPPAPLVPCRGATPSMIGSINFRASIGYSSTTTTADAFGSALLYANNFLTASKTGYGLKDSDSAIAHWNVS